MWAQLVANNVIPIDSEVFLPMTRQSFKTNSLQNRYKIVFDPFTPTDHFSSIQNSGWKSLLL